MEKLRFKFILFLVLGLSLNVMAHGIDGEKVTKTIKESFDVNNGAKLSIENKYGDVNITTWDKNQIDIEVTIKVEAGSEDKAQKFLDGIKIHMSGSADKVSARTEYPTNKSSSWWGGWNGSKKLEYEVNYAIKAPASISSRLINKYGNISQASISGAAIVENKYGDIYCQDIGKDLTLNLGYGDARIGNTGNCDVEIKYSSLRLKNAQDIDIVSKYSEIEFGDCGNITSDTKYDDYKISSVVAFANEGKYDDWRIGSAQEIKIDSRYTDLYITSLARNGYFDTSYGEVDISEISVDAEKITVIGSYTDVELGSMGDLYLNLEGKYTDVYLSRNIEKIEKIKDGSRLTLKAFRGNKKTGCQMNIKMHYGSVNID